MYGAEADGAEAATDGAHQAMRARSLLPGAVRFRV